MGTHFKLSPSHRAAVEEQIESLIAMLDAFDGDCNMEDDDPAGGAIEDSPELDRDGLHCIGPRYALDQSAGPINYEAAGREHFARERGLVRSPTGGWRHPPSLFR